LAALRHSVGRVTAPPVADLQLTDQRVDDPTSKVALRTVQVKSGDGKRHHRVDDAALTVVIPYRR
jgi:hypothetical protein